MWYAYVRYTYSWRTNYIVYSVYQTFILYTLVSFNYISSLLYFSWKVLLKNIFYILVVWWNVPEQSILLVIDGQASISKFEFGPDI